MPYGAALAQGLLSKRPARKKRPNKTDEDGDGDGDGDGNDDATAGGDNPKADKTPDADKEKTDKKRRKRGFLVDGPPIHRPASVMQVNYVGRHRFVATGGRSTAVAGADVRSTVPDTSIDRHVGVSTVETMYLPTVVVNELTEYHAPGIAINRPLLSSMPVIASCVETAESLNDRRQQTAAGVVATASSFSTASVRVLKLLSLHFQSCESV